MASAAFSFPAAPPAMESRIWRRLPEKLLERVLAFLPPAAFFRARAVCRRWYALLFSDAFLELQLRLSPRRRWLLFFQHDLPASFVYSGEPAAAAPPPRHGLLFDPDEFRWRRLPFDAVVPPDFYPAASSGGLLCWLPLCPGPKPLLLCNPLSRLALQPPPSLRHRLLPSVGFAVGETSLVVLLAGDDLISPFAVKNLTAERLLIDGLSGRYTPWGAPAAPPPRLCNLPSGRMIFHGGSFFCMSHSPFAVLSYDIAGDVWKKLQAPMKRFLRSPSLVELAGGVAMVAAVEKRKLAVPRSVRVWGLKEGGWAEVERMPAAVHEEFAAEERGRGFEAVGEGGTVAITIRGSGAVLVFELRRREWRWLPACPLLRNGAACGGGGGLRGFAFEPRLATPALGLLQAAPPTPFPFQG
ncbi:unnamed protein product [Spirodela intermedia]|uniref:F-box domain-containing protein n=1 Tax=Spirodela intermedia TaxID=51605 RepID=A0A7I8L7C0_SPIIN|nr:unnamed protein product [Spirodela intermedia]